MGLHWRYDRTEILADGIVHVVGMGLALLGVIHLIVVSWGSSERLETASIVIYALGLLAMLGCSAAYNMWPVSPRKWWLRRFDHSAIFLFIAATYTPLIAQMDLGRTTFALLIGVWLVAALGVWLKFSLPGRFDGLSTGLCLLLGGSGLLAYEFRGCCFADFRFVAHRNRRRTVFDRKLNISSLGDAPFSECDMA